MKHRCNSSFTESNDVLTVSNMSIYEAAQSYIMIVRVPKIVGRLKITAYTLS